MDSVQVLRTMSNADAIKARKQNLLRYMHVACFMCHNANTGRAERGNKH